MCGIVGCLGFKNPREYVLNGLKTLDYRGYDSAGVAYYNDGIRIYKDVGAVEHLMELVPQDIKTEIMIGHTRWATHGVPNVANTHPHISKHKKICLVHNGVIENYEDVKKFLIGKHYDFYGDTDSEIVANLIEHYYLSENDILDALKKCMFVLKGSYALAIICNDYPDEMFVMKNGSPLVIGKGDGFNFVASDASPMIKYTDAFIELNDQE